MRVHETREVGPRPTQCKPQGRIVPGSPAPSDGLLRRPRPLGRPAKIWLHQCDRCDPSCFAVLFALAACCSARGLASAVCRRCAGHPDSRRQHFGGLRTSRGHGVASRCCSSDSTAEHYPYSVVNASISGDTTAGGRARLDALLAQHRPAITVIELGGNDGLRGSSIDAMRQNLDAMAAAAQKVGSRVLLVGMRMPPNYGPAYVQRFDASFADVAKARKTALVPFSVRRLRRRRRHVPGRSHPSGAGRAAEAARQRLAALKPLLGAPGKTG